jgi:hypothetical protein
MSGMDTVPVPVITIFVVPPIEPVVKLDTVRDWVLIVDPLNTLMLDELAESTVVPAVMTYAPEKVRVLPDVCKFNVPLQFKLEPSVIVKRLPLLIVILSHTTVLVFTVHEDVSDIVEPVVITVPAM